MDIDAACGYDRMHDPAVLRLAVDELARVRTWIGQTADIAAESAGLSPDHVLGIHAAVGVVGRLQELATTRLKLVLSRQPSAAVTVTDPGQTGVGTSASVVESSVVSVPAVATAGLSSSVVSLRPGHRSLPRQYPDDVIVVGLVGTVHVIWWDACGVKHQRESPRWHHTHVGRGTRHCLYNAGLLPAQALQSRGNSDMTADVIWDPGQSGDANASDIPIAAAPIHLTAGAPSEPTATGTAGAAVTADTAPSAQV